jgi:hypothetical protein
MHSIKNDTRALAVFQAQLSRDSSFGTSVTLNVSDDGENIELEEDEDDYEKWKVQISPLKVK